MKIFLMLLVILFSTAAQAALVTVPAEKGIPPRANAPGMGYSPPPPNFKPTKPTAPKPSYPQPAYIETGKPVYPTAPKVERTCRDNSGNVVKCTKIIDKKKPDPAKTTNVNPKTKILPFKN